RLFVIASSEDWITTLPGWSPTAFSHVDLPTPAGPSIMYMVAIISPLSIPLNVQMLRDICADQA
ncbi:hypothetical protein, partial [Klebsiella pneumoniae]|uniref:hypothetical protein n=1 Tax=Klebsiella pneumoniae TaxID=573 RepID=UPI00200EC175